MPGLLSFLDTLQSRRIPFAAVTNAPRANATIMLNALNLTSTFPKVIIGAECTRAKPHPDPYLEGLRQLGLTPADAARCIAVEDSPSGLTAAVAANLPTFGIIGGGAVHAPEKLLSVGAVACVNDYHEVLTHLTKERA